MVSGGCGRVVRVGSVEVGNHLPLVLIAGPCVIEGEEFALRTAAQLKDMASRLGVPLIYKSSFDKANRTSTRGFRGVGVEAGLAILAKVRRELGMPVVTDVHESRQAALVGSVVDLLQTPAYLCRQTDLIEAVARTGRPVNIKKGQFLAPGDMVHVAGKAEAVGNRQLLFCDRGTQFGYRDLVVDMRGLAIMAATGYPVVFDATHSVQLPGGLGGASGGERRFVAPLARAAVAVGVAALFLEVHPDPDKAPCDGPNMLPLEGLESLVAGWMRLDEIVKGSCGITGHWQEVSA
ncbi:MAG: 3-deoxy-8-phosphooctulonate synthase [Magnetococcales bacterium]|nr:3-deoxy-8-phosphooctulonate synthase [Magnetococcales bacterium]MBF0156740.1 3-deoxy-8-phosphooctulonate synthase [Magnetococcales bacterium]